MPHIEIAGKSILIEEEARYIQVDDVNEKEAEEIWRHIEAEYPGFTVDFCFHNTVAPIPFLKKIGAEVLDDCIEARLVKKNLISLPTGEVTAVDKNNFHLFEARHDENNPGMFWTSQRLLNDLKNWDIFATFDQKGEKMTGYAFLRSGWEIYCVDAESLEEEITLISALVNKAFDANPDKEVLFMVDSNDYRQLGAALHLGFRRAGYYIGYRVEAKT